MASHGVLLLHGLSSSLATVAGLVPHLRDAGYVFRMPVLRGHGATPEALHGVRARDWIDDAASALDDLLAEVDQAFVVGVSMGGLVALTLAMEHPERLAGVVTLAAALRFVDPLAPFSPYLGWARPRVPVPGAEPDEGYVATSYSWIPVKSFEEVYLLGRTVESRLDAVQAPLLAVGAERDRVVRPECARIIAERAGSSSKQLRMFAQSGHEMLQSREKDAVMATVMEFLAVRAGREVPRLGTR